MYIKNDTIKNINDNLNLRPIIKKITAAMST